MSTSRERGVFVKHTLASPRNALCTQAYTSPLLQSPRHQYCLARPVSVLRRSQVSHRGTRHSRPSIAPPLLHGEEGEAYRQTARDQTSHPVPRPPHEYSDDPPTASHDQRDQERIVPRQWQSHDTCLNRPARPLRSRSPHRPLSASLDRGKKCSPFHIVYPPHNLR